VFRPEIDDGVARARGTPDPSSASSRLLDRAGTSAHATHHGERLESCAWERRPREAGESALTPRGSRASAPRDGRGEAREGARSPRRRRSLVQRLPDPLRDCGGHLVQGEGHRALKAIRPGD